MRNIIAFSLILLSSFLCVSCNSGDTQYGTVVLGNVVYNTSSIRLKIGESADIVASYVGGNVSILPYTVNFYLAESGLGAISPNQCNLSWSNNCTIKFNALSAGVTSLYSNSGIESVSIIVTK